MVLKTNEQAKLLAEAIAILDEISALIFEHNRPRLGLHDMQQQVVRKPFAVFEKNARRGTCRRVHSKISRANRAITNAHGARSTV